MARTYYSKIYKISPENFSEIVKASTTYTEILKRCGYKDDGCNINTIKRRILLEKINADHIKKGYSHNKGRQFLHRQVSLEDALKKYFVVRDYYKLNIRFLRTLILRFNLKDYKCNVCKMEAVWENKPLSLQLHHINGNTNDNRLENLMFLCPNCHTQTENFSGKTSKKIYKCSICGIEVNKQAKMCLDCLEVKVRKVDRPCKEKIIELSKNLSAYKIGKMFGVSDNTIRKWSVDYGIILPDMRGRYERK